MCPKPDYVVTIPALGKVPWGVGVRQPTVLTILLCPYQSHHPGSVPSLSGVMAVWDPISQDLHTYKTSACLWLLTGHFPLLVTFGQLYQGAPGTL